MNSGWLVEQTKVTHRQLLFNSALQSAMEKDIGTSNEKGLGIKLSDDKVDNTSNLRFAGDVLMMATSWKQLKKMMADFEKIQKRKGSKSTRINENSHHSEIEQVERTRD